VKEMKPYEIVDCKIDCISSSHINEIRRKLEDKIPFVVVRNVISEDKVDSVVEYIKESIGMLSIPEENKSFKMLDSYEFIDSSVDTSIFRDKKMYLSIFYPWNQKYNFLATELKSLFNLRDEINLLDKEKIKNFYTPIQLLHYPRGGGWLVKHTDDYVKSSNLKPEEELNYNVILLSCSNKGESFKTGGLYGILGGEKIVLEDVLCKGDIVIFNSSEWHGVDPVDPEGLQTSNLDNGRLTLLITPFPNSRLSGV
jgi:hypothetical protein